MHLQAGVIPYDRFVRCVGLGPQTRVVNYDPSAPLHDRYRMDRDFISADEQRKLRTSRSRSTRSSAGISIPARRCCKGGEWYPIDFANACPDSQVTSLHYHFPGSSRRTCAGRSSAPTTKAPGCAGISTGSRTSGSPAKDLSAHERLRGYALLAREHFATDSFREFCAKHLAHLDDVAYEFFGSTEARDAVRKKVTALYPAHEIEQFTELFFNRIQEWRKIEGRTAAI